MTTLFHVLKFVLHIDLQERGSDRNTVNWWKRIDGKRWYTV